MWSDVAQKITLEYYKNNYAQYQKELYNVYVPTEIHGGLYGLKLLLGLEQEYTDIIEIYTVNPLQVARKIADDYYQKNQDIFIYVRTVIPNKELEIIRRGRKIASVFIESTAKDTFIQKDIDGQIHKFISPKLYMIGLLQSLYLPDHYSKRESNMELLNKLLDITDGFVGHKPMDYKYLGGPAQDKVIVYSSSSHVILITDKLLENEKQFFERKSKMPVQMHSVRLPGEYFMKKITAKIDNIRYTIYNVGSYELIPYNEKVINNKLWKIAIPSVTARFLLIEDNSTLSLVNSGVLKFGVYLTSRQHIKDVTTEVYPSVQFFYGYHQNLAHLKRKLIKEQERYGLYFPYIGAKKNVSKDILSEEINKESEF